MWRVWLVTNLEIVLTDIAVQDQHAFEQILMRWSVCQKQLQRGLEG